MAKYFLFMYFDDFRIRSYLDLAISVLNPRERWPAHVTIAGPYARKLEIPRALSFIQEVSILGRGRFDSERRHTVFLHVGSRDMSAHVEKPDYPHAIPHLSLYNGPDLEIADLLFEGLADLRPYGVFYSRQLEVVESKEQYSFNLKMQIDTGILSSTKGRTLEELSALGKTQRVDIALNAIDQAFHRSFDVKKALGAAP